MVMMLEKSMRVREIKGCIYGKKINEGKNTVENVEEKTRLERYERKTLLRFLFNDRKERLKNCSRKMIKQKMEVSPKSRRSHLYVTTASAEGIPCSCFAL